MVLVPEVAALWVVFEAVHEVEVPEDATVLL